MRHLAPLLDTGRSYSLLFVVEEEDMAMENDSTGDILNKMILRLAVAAIINSVVPNFMFVVCFVLSVQIKASFGFVPLAPLHRSTKIKVKTGDKGQR
mmetsp:Transcript_7085/g.13357  ORF Transcript_7085/g.13357 Transcript_7085/m.13357 type:complete len:97 (+) Transcript_7085:1169-1459(+)